MNRLYPSNVFAAFPQQAVTEAQRCDLASAILFIKSMGIDNIKAFECIDELPPEHVALALEV